MGKRICKERGRKQGGTLILITIVSFLFILGFSITIHEFGHFLFAKIFRIPVEKFSIGFGPPLVRKKIGETDFRIAYIPVGGYVKMAGEEDVEMPFTKIKDDEQESVPTENYIPVKGFYDAPLFHRILVVLSGPLFNIFSAVVVLIIIYIFWGIYVNPYLRVRVEKNSYAERIGFMDRDSIVSINGRVLNSWDELETTLATLQNKTVDVVFKRGDSIVEKNITLNLDSLVFSSYVPPLVGSLKVGGPAHKAGMSNNDSIIRIDGETIETWDEFVAKVRKSKNIPLQIEWLHNHELRSAIVTPLPYYDPLLKDTIGQIGIVMPLRKVHIEPLRAVAMAGSRSIELIYLTLKTLYQLIIGEISRKALGGPIAIAKLTGESARWGIENLLTLLSVISINLGLVNLFPIPALDGGHIVIAIIEGVRQKRFSKKTRFVIQQIGFAIILLLIIYVTFNDLTR
ncbi:MAG: RIP metalloprotease RseP [candidate division WOR-3 bacterium]